MQTCPSTFTNDTEQSLNVESLQFISCTNFLCWKNKTIKFWSTFWIPFTCSTQHLDGVFIVSKAQHAYIECNRTLKKTITRLITKRIYFLLSMQIPKPKTIVTKYHVEYLSDLLWKLIRSCFHKAPSNITLTFN